jgi:hypothetical protein
VPTFLMIYNGVTSFLNEDYTRGHHWVILFLTWYIFSAILLDFAIHSFKWTIVLFFIFSATAILFPSPHFLMFITIYLVFALINIALGFKHKSKLN